MMDLLLLSGGADHSDGRTAELLNQRAALRFGQVCLALIGEEELSSELDAGDLHSPENQGENFLLAAC